MSVRRTLGLFLLFSALVHAGEGDDLPWIFEGTTNRFAAAMQTIAMERRWAIGDVSAKGETLSPIDTRIVTVCRSVGLPHFETTPTGQVIIIR